MNRKIRIAITAVWSTHREVMRARFPMIAGLLVAVIFLFVPQGREILNVMAQPSVAQAELLRVDFNIFAPTAGMNWGWIAAFWSSALALSLACWAFSRLLLTMEFSVPGQREDETALIAERAKTPWHAGLEDACEAILPTLFGALPLVAIGCALLQNGQTLTMDSHGFRWLGWFCRLYPLLVICGIPLLVLTVDGVKRAGQKDQRTQSVVLQTLLNIVPIALALPIVVSVVCSIFLPGRRTCLEAAAFFLLAFTIFGLKRLKPAVFLGIAILGCALWRALTVGKGKSGLLGLIPGDPQIHPWQMAETWMGVIGGIFAITIPLAFRLDWKDRRLRLWLVGSGLLYLASILALIISRTDLSRWVGCGAVLLVGLGFWLCLLGGIQSYARRERVPWLVILTTWMALCTLTNDNHRVRTFPGGVFGSSPRLAGSSGSSGVDRPADVAAACERWKAVPSIKEELARGATPPMFIVVTEGGGVRAAFWTATVLSALEDLAALDRPDLPRPFLNHCFAITGVSGGSVGGTLFAAMNTTEHVHAGGEALDVLKEDLLSPLIAGLICNDWLQCALPLPIRWFDRGGRFEQNLEERFSIYLDPAEANALSGPMLDLNAWRAQAPKNWTPYLFLNSTSVEEGNRVIFSDVKINGGERPEFANARDGHTLLSADSRFDAKDLPLSTAAHNSARFPYTNPTGRLPGDQRITDGGLFENSGATTGLEIARAIQRHEFAVGSATKPQIVMIVVRFDDTVAAPEWNLAGHFLHGLTGPLTALVSARSARATYGTEALSAAVPKTDPPLGIEVITFTARTRRTMQPLGWQLSALAARDLYFQMPHELIGKAPGNNFEALKKAGKPVPEEGFDMENLPGALRVLELLRGAAIPPTSTQ